MLLAWLVFKAVREVHARSSMGHHTHAKTHGNDVGVNGVGGMMLNVHLLLLGGLSLDVGVRSFCAKKVGGPSRRSSTRSICCR